MSADLKNKIRRALEIKDLESVAVLAQENRNVLSQLVRLAYHKDTIIGWRAIKTIGLAAKSMVKTDYEFLRETCRKLLWSLSDESGGIGWSAPEILGEIVGADPERFSDIIPLIAEVFEIEEKVFRPGILYALGRIAASDPVSVVRFKGLISRALAEGDPLSRIYAIDLFEMLKRCLHEDDRKDINDAMKELSLDRSEAWLYMNYGFINIEIGEYVKKHLSNVG